MRLRDWLRRCQRQAQATSSSLGSGTSPIDDYASSTALHAAIAMNTLFPDAARHTLPESSTPYGPHHVPHDGGNTGNTEHSFNHSHSHHSDAGSSSSFDSGGSSYDSSSSTGGFGSGAASSI